MIKTTLGAIVDANKVLDPLKKEKLPIAAAVALARVARLVKAEAQLFEEKRNEFITELGVERPATPDEKAMADPNGNVVSVTKENMPEFARRLSELAVCEVELACDPIAIAALGDIAMTPEDVDRLGPFIQLD